MQSLKPGWKMVKFGDVVRQCKEKVDRSNNPFQRYIEGGHIDSEDIHIRRWGEFGSAYVGPAFHRIFRKGQVLYGSRRTYLKKVAVADFDGITANTTFVCETKDQNIFMQELLPFLMLTESFTNHSIRESKGSTNPYINWSDIAKYEFPLPPLEEQKRLAELLWAADDTISQYEILANQYKKIKKIIIRDCTKNCDRWVYLSDIAQNITSGSRGWAKFYSSNGSKFIRITNLHRGCIHIDLNDIQHVSPPLNLESERTRIKKNDLLISITADLGLVAVADTDIGDAYVNQHIAKISLDENIYNPLFAAYFFADTMGQKQFSRFNDQGAKAGLNLKNIGRLKLPFIQKKEQKIFSYLLAKIDKKNQKTLSHIESLRKVMRALCDNWGK